MNFWEKLLNRGVIVGLSPMDGVTDAPMRYMTAKYGKPDVIYTEFVSVDALSHAKNPEAVERLMNAFLRIEEVGPLEDKPYQVAQVFGHDPELFYQAAVIISTLGFDGMDINMGCPAPNVQERGSGAGLIRTPDLAVDIVRAAKNGVKDWASGKIAIDDLQISEAIKEWVKKHKKEVNNRESIPVSVKTRLGVENVVVEEWMKKLMEVRPDMITLHGRTLKQLYQGEANWDEIGKAATVVHSLGGKILGNGDVHSLNEGKSKAREYGVDGFLIGRAAEGNPAIFVGNDEPSWEERKKWMLEHARIYEKVFGERYFMPMRKHLAWYCKGFAGASDLRVGLVHVSNLDGLHEVLRQSQD